MTQEYRLSSRIKLSDHSIRPNWTLAEVKKEPMLFGCDPITADLLGGPITRCWLDALYREFPEGDTWDDAIIDTRVHMLMPGFFPCIPGWHHDDIPRTREDGQPDYEGRSDAFHAMSIVGTDTSQARTEFAIGEAWFPGVAVGQKIYKSWSPIVDLHVAAERLHSLQICYGEIVRFNANTWHRGVAATAPCWRWFGRVGFRSGRVPQNETRNQVQAYLLTEEEGW